MRKIRKRGKNRMSDTHRYIPRCHGLLRCVLHVMLVMFALMCVSSATFAQSSQADPRVIELEELVIEGKVSKPEVFYVLGRSGHRYEGLRLKRSFVSRILSDARSNPF